jgi:hypothetical protein
VSSLGFSRIIESAPNTPKNGILYLKKNVPYLCLTHFQGIFLVKEKRELFLELSLMSPSLLVLPPFPNLS